MSEAVRHARWRLFLGEDQNPCGSLRRAFSPVTPSTTIRHTRPLRSERWRLIPGVDQNLCDSLRRAFSPVTSSTGLTVAAADGAGPRALARYGVQP